MSGERIMKHWNFEILEYWKNASPHQSINPSIHSVNIRLFHQYTNPSIHQSIL